jgi:hypothetical protein
MKFWITCKEIFCYCLKILKDGQCVWLHFCISGFLVSGREKYTFRKKIFCSLLPDTVKVTQKFGNKIHWFFVQGYVFISVLTYFSEFYTYNIPQRQFCVNDTVTILENLNLFFFATTFVSVCSDTKMTNTNINVHTWIIRSNLISDTV